MYIIYIYIYLHKSLLNCDRPLRHWLMDAECTAMQCSWNLVATWAPHRSLRPRRHDATSSGAQVLPDSQVLPQNWRRQQVCERKL